MSELFSIMSPSLHVPAHRVFKMLKNMTCPSKPVTHNTSTNVLPNATGKMNGKTNSDPTNVKTIVIVMVSEPVKKDGVKVTLDQKIPNVKTLMREKTSPMIIPTNKNAS